ncbi:transcriptional regulator [Mariniluteicoccus endophyticus]
MSGFDETVHAPVRLKVCAALRRVESAEFGALRDDLGIADSVLSKHLKVLVEAGYVVLDKPTGRGRVRTWARLTKQGRTAFDGHVAALRALVESPVEDVPR